MRADLRMRSVLQNRRADVGREGDTLTVVISPFDSLTVNQTVRTAPLENYTGSNAREGLRKHQCFRHFA